MTINGQILLLLLPVKFYVVACWSLLRPVTEIWVPPVRLLFLHDASAAPSLPRSFNFKTDARP